MCMLQFMQFAATTCQNSHFLCFCNEQTKHRTMHSRSPAHSDTYSRYSFGADSVAAALHNLWCSCGWWIGWVREGSMYVSPFGQNQTLSLKTYYAVLTEIEKRNVQRNDTANELASQSVFVEFCGPRWWRFFCFCRLLQIEHEPFYFFRWYKCSIVTWLRFPLVGINWLLDTIDTHALCMHSVFFIRIRFMMSPNDVRFFCYLAIFRYIISVSLLESVLARKKSWTQKHRHDFHRQEHISLTDWCYVRLKMIGALWMSVACDAPTGPME